MSESFVEYLRDQLRDLGELRLRRMFGAYGLYCGPVFFGIAHQDRLYFRTDARSRGEYIARGMQPFQPNPRQTLKNYYEVPADAIDEAAELVDWARRALAARPKPKRRPNTPRRMR